MEQVQQVQTPPTGKAMRRAGVAVALVVLAIAMLARDRILFREIVIRGTSDAGNHEWRFGILSTARVSPEPAEMRWFFESETPPDQIRLWLSIAALALVAGGLVLAARSAWSRGARTRFLLAGVLIASAPALWGALFALVASLWGGGGLELSVDWLTPLLAIGTLAIGVYGARMHLAQRTETTTRDQGAARIQGHAPTQDGKPDATRSASIQPGSAETPRGDGQTSAPGPAPTVPMGVASRVRVTLLVGCIIGLLCMLFDVPLYAAPPERRGRGPTDTYSLWSWTGDERRDPMLTPSYSDLPPAGCATWSR